MDKQKQMEPIDSQALTLIKCQPEEILFINRNTRIVYRYLDSPNKQPPHCSLSHPCILKGIPFQQGYLYPKEQSTLLLQVSQRARSHIKKQFSQEEIVNTFEPLFQCLQYLHQNGVTHGSIHLDSIVIVDDEIKMRDWNAPTQLTCQYYPEHKRTAHDIHALGLCLLKCIVLSVDQLRKTQKQTILEQITDRYSKNLVIAAIIIVKELEENYQEIPKLLRGNNLTDPKLIQEHQMLVLQKDRRKRQPNHQLEGLPISPGSLIKKVAISTSKKVFHHENIENKKESETKVGAEKVLKKAQKGGLAFELANKKLNDQERRVKEQSVKRVISKPAILNLSNFGIENNSKRLGKERFSPLMKGRNYSRKK